jgi:hypothetical protein
LLRTRSAVFLLVALSCGGVLSAHPLPDLDAENSLTLPKGEGRVLLQTSYGNSSDFFVGGERRGSAPDGTSQDYDDWTFAFEAAYGLTDRLNLWLSIPLVDRTESLAYHASDTGMGDATAGARYRFWRSDDKNHEAAFEWNGRFPSGDTDVHFVDPARGERGELPLGKGSSEIEPGILYRRRFLDDFTVLLSASYAFSFSALVEYLSTSPVALPASDGTIYSLPVGNLRIDWGDRLSARAAFGYRFLDRFRVEGNVTWFHRRPVTIRSFTMGQSGNTITSLAGTVTSGSSRLLTVTPAFSAQLLERLRLRVSAEIPLSGRNYPFLPVVESAVGNRYSLEVQHGF